MELPEEAHQVEFTHEEYIPDQCSVDEDPFAHLTAWQVIAKNILEPLMPMIPGDAAPIAREHPITSLVGAASLFILLLAAALRVILNSIQPKTVVLYGPMESGKTSLLHALQGSKLPNGTVSSMKATESIFMLPGSSKQVKVIDVPGHPRLRSVYEVHASSASCIVFVLDSSTFVADKHAVAEQLYHVLRHRAQSGRNRGAVVIACNKADLEERAFSQDFIVRQLEKEINSFRSSKSADVTGASSVQDGLGRMDVPFTFHASVVTIRMCTISAARLELQGLLSTLVS